jgi:hypothetical protein
MDSSNLTGGLRVQTQIPLDVKQYSPSESNLSDLGISNNLAFTYVKGLVVYCIEEGTRWEWREVLDGEENTGLLSEDFVYPNGLITFGIDYSLKSFNFFPYVVDGQIGPQGPQGPQGIQGNQGIQGIKGDDGEQGIPGINGENGINGLSAYEQALENGFEGSASEWLLSLVGPEGPQGETGPSGGINSVTDDGNIVVIVDNEDPLNPVIKFNGVIADGETIGGSGTVEDPLYLLEINDIYSTTETLTNKKWINNKPIYRKVITGSTTTISKSILINANLEEICLHSGTWSSNGGETINIFPSYITVGIDSVLNKIVSLEKEYFMSGTTYPNTLTVSSLNREVISFGATLTPVAIDFTVIVEYTKTTD